MSWLYSRALVEASSEDISLDGAQSALWNGTHTQLPSWCSDKTIAACRLSRSGTTFKPLTDADGEAVLMSYLEASLARTSAPPEKKQESTERDPVCGNTWRELLVKCDPASRSWRTHHCLWEEDLPESSVTLPRWGMMRGGELWERITLPPLTSGTESGSWPTPRAQDSKHGAATEWELNTDHAGTKDSLRVQVVKRLWPTPTAGNHKSGGRMDEWGGSGARASIAHLPKEERCGKLNPSWVEWLMGWPIGWTDLSALETDKSLSVQP